MTTMKRERSPTGTLGRLDDLVFMNNNLPNMPMSIFALLVIPNFNQFLPADGVCPMAHRSAL